MVGLRVPGNQCHGAVRCSKSWMALDQRSARSQALMPLFTLEFLGKNLSDWVKKNGSFSVESSTKT